MTTAFVDTNVFVRFLTNDIPERQARAAALFNRVRRGELHLTTPASTIAEIVYVLHSPRLYNKSRNDIVNMLLPLIKLTGIKLHQRHVIIKALSLFESTKLSFGDAMIAASLLVKQGQVLYSFDKDFDGVQAFIVWNPNCHLRNSYNSFQNGVDTLTSYRLMPTIQHLFEMSCTNTLGG